jgi:hypothetical protein
MTYPRVHTTALFFIRAEFAKKKKKNAVEEPFLNFFSFLSICKITKKERSGAQQQPTVGVDYNTLFIMENKN